MKNVVGGLAAPGSVGSHSCCISAYLADGGYQPYPMQFTPQTVASQTDCQKLADKEALSRLYTNVHYDTDCDGK